MQKENPVLVKSFEFAVRIVNLYKYLALFQYVVVVICIGT